MGSAGIAQLVEQLICNSKMGFCYLWSLVAGTLGITMAYMNSSLALIGCDLPVFEAAV